MKKLLSVCSVLILGLSAPAAGLRFSATNLPSQTGQYNRSYFSTDNPNVTAMLAFTTNASGLLPGSPGPTWDFSQPQLGGESIQRTDIIAPANGPGGSSFPEAAYAEQDSTESSGATNQTAWRYYAITNSGRLYYGSYVPISGADGLAQFDSPTLDIPATVTNGQTWSRNVSWNTTFGGFFGLYYQFSDTSKADAEGLLLLPGLAPVPALRVHETHGYTGLLGGYFPYEVVTNQYYYWLVPGLGVAAQITVHGDDLLNPGNLPFTNSVERMFFASYYTNPTGSISGPFKSNLFIKLQGGSAALNWLPFTNLAQVVSTNYQVQAKGSLTGTNWQVLGLTSNTNWFDSLTPTQRIYRVIGFP